MSVWDIHTMISIGLTVGTVLIALIILGITSRRVNYLMSEMQTLRREIGLLDEAVQTVANSLTDRADASPKPEILRTGSPPSEPSS